MTSSLAVEVLEARNLHQGFEHYAGMGSAIATSIDTTMRATIRHSDSPPIASRPATTWVSLDKATGAERPSKPTAPDDRGIAENP